MTFPALTNLLWSTWVRPRHHPLPAHCYQKLRILSVKVDAHYDKGIREAKALPVAAKNPRFILVEVMFVMIGEFAKQRHRPLPSKVSATFQSR